MPDPTDLPAVLLEAIRAEPDDAERWRALANWLFIEARDDEASVVWALWPTLRNNLAVASLETTMADLAANAKVFAKIARMMERQGDETPPV